MTISRRNLLKTSAGLPALFIAGNVAWSADGAGTLRAAVTKASPNLDPRKYKAVWALQDLIFEPLVQYGPGGTIEPALAKGWQLSPNGKVLTLKLQENVTFSDGTPFNAEAALWNLKQWIGLEDYNWINTSLFFAGMKAIDEHTIEITFKQPVPGLFYELSFVRPVRFQSTKAVDGEGKFVKAIGTGPWVEETNNESGSTFVRNETYWGAKPSFDKIEIKVLPDARSRVDAMRAGELDITGGEFVAALTAQEADTLRQAGMNVIVEPGSTTMVLAFNPDRNPALADKAVREAINIGYDRAAISKVLFMGDAKPAGDLFGDSVPMAGKRHDAPARDVEKAKAMLEAAGWVGEPVRAKDGKPISLELLVSDEQISGSRVLGEVLQQQLAEIGIEVKIRSVDHASRHSDIPKRLYDMAIFLTLGAPYEPYSTVVNAFLSTYDSGVDGKIAVDATNLDPLITAAVSAVGDEAQAATLQAFYDYCANNVVFSPMIYKPTYWATAPRVKGFKAPATEYDFPYEGISLG